MSLNQKNVRLMTLISNGNAIKNGKSQQGNVTGVVGQGNKEQLHQYQQQSFVTSARTNINGQQPSSKSAQKTRISSGSHGNLFQTGALETALLSAASNYHTTSSSSSTIKPQNQQAYQHHPTAQHSRNNSNIESNSLNPKRTQTPGQFQVGQKYIPLGYDSQVVPNKSTISGSSKLDFAYEMKKLLAGSAQSGVTKLSQQASLVVNSNANNTNSSINNFQQSQQLQQSSSASALLHLPQSQNQQSQQKKSHHGYSLSEVHETSLKPPAPYDSYGSYAEMNSLNKKANFNKTDDLLLFQKSVFDLKQSNVPVPPLFNIPSDSRTKFTQKPTRETSSATRKRPEQPSYQQQQKQQLIQRQHTENINNNNPNIIISTQNEDPSRKVFTDSDDVRIADKHFLSTKPIAPQFSSSSLMKELKAKKATQSAMYKQVTSQKLTNHLRTDSSGTGASFLKQSFQQSYTTQKQQNLSNQKSAVSGMKSTSAQQSGNRTPLELVNLNNSQKMLVNSKKNEKNKIVNSNSQHKATVSTASLDSSSFKNYLKQLKNITPNLFKSKTDTFDNNSNVHSTFPEQIPQRDSSIPKNSNNNDQPARSFTPQNTRKQQAGATNSNISTSSQQHESLSPPKQLQLQSPYGLRAPNNPSPDFALKNPQNNSNNSTTSIKNPPSTHSTSASSQQASPPTVLPQQIKLSADSFSHNQMHSFIQQSQNRMTQNSVNINNPNSFLNGQNITSKTIKDQPTHIDNHQDAAGFKQQQYSKPMLQITNSNNQNDAINMNLLKQQNNNTILPTKNEETSQTNAQELSYFPIHQQTTNSSIKTASQQQQEEEKLQKQSQSQQINTQKAENSFRQSFELIPRSLQQEQSSSSSAVPTSCTPLSSLHLSVIKEVSYKTKAGCNFNGPKTNQDNFFIVNNLNNLPHRTLFSVCDGHGVNGHYCSAFLKKILPLKIEEALAREITNTKDDFIENSLHLAFLQASKELLESSIDCTFSGSTCVLLLVIGNKMWTANAGDSRAILCSSTDDYWYVNPLSRDHKPDDPDEYERIISRGGRVQTYLDQNLNQVGPYRVWLQDQNIPGLAMARSFGDVIASQVGVICEPEVIAFDVGSEDKFIVLASDGVWEFISNEEVMSMLVPSFNENDIESGCTRLIKESHASWKRNDDVVDDITCIVVYLKHS